MGTTSAPSANLPQGTARLATSCYPHPAASVFPFALSRRFSDALAMDWVRGDGRASSDVPWAPRLANVSTAAGVKLFSRSVSISTRSTQRSTQINRYHGWPSICPQECRPRARGPRPAAATSSERRRQRPASKEGVRRLHRPPRPPLGIKPGMAGDNIYNGAMDNRSGVATLIEMARLIAQMPVKPKRSMLFIALTGEEKVCEDRITSRRTRPCRRRRS